jgi:hypothetical protein
MAFARRPRRVLRMKRVDRVWIQATRSACAVLVVLVAGHSALHLLHVHLNLSLSRVWAARINSSFQRFDV